MLSVSETIAEIIAALSSNPDERYLLNLIEQSLESLRSKYRSHRNEYQDSAIEFLKSLSLLQDTLREFIEAVEEKEWVRTRDDAQELAGRFGELRDKLSPHRVAKRAEKELREVISKAQDLPFSAVFAGEADVTVSFRQACMKSCPLAGTVGAPSVMIRRSPDVPVNPRGRRRTGAGRRRLCALAR